MKPRYVSKPERDNMVVLDALASRLIEQILPNVDAYGKEVAWRWRSVATNLVKGFKAYMATLSPDDERKLRRESSTTQIVLTSRAYKPTAEVISEQTQHNWTLAEFAMGQNCRGCTKDGESCELKHALAMAEVPYVDTEPENCPYELPS